MSQNPFAQASTLIQQKRYDEARSLLRPLNSDKSRSWLTKIDLLDTAESVARPVPPPKSLMERLSESATAHVGQQKRFGKVSRLASLGGVEFYEDGILLNWESSFRFEKQSGIANQYGFIPIQHVSSIAIVRSRVLANFVWWVGVLFLLITLVFLFNPGGIIFALSYRLQIFSSSTFVIPLVIGILILVTWYRWLNNEVLISSDGSEGIYVSGIDIESAMTFIETYRELKQSLLTHAHPQTRP